MYFTTAKFWADLTERSVSTAAQSALGVVTASAFGLVDLASWGAVATVAGTSALVAVLKAFAVGRGDTPAPVAVWQVSPNASTADLRTDSERHADEQAAGNNRTQFPYV